MATWLRKNNFDKLVDLFEMKKFTQISDLCSHVTRADIEEVGLLSPTDTNRFFSMLENYKSKNFPLKRPKRKALVLEFLGENDQNVRLDPENLPIVCGKSDMNAESGQQ